MEIIRKILMCIEDKKKPYDRIRVSIPDVPDELISYHVELLKNAGYITAIDLRSLSGYAWEPKDLSWNGHDYIEVIRDEKRWADVQKYIKDKKQIFTMDTMQLACDKLFLGNKGI